MEYPYNFLAIELAVRLQDLLEPGEDLPPYEYHSEAVEILGQINVKDIYDTEIINTTIAEVLSENLEFKYLPESFIDIAEFLTKRKKYFHKYQLKD